MNKIYVGVKQTRPLLNKQQEQDLGREREQAKTDLACLCYFRLHDYFISAVAENRGLSEKKVREIATGMFYLGSEAKELGLVDVLGGKEEAIKIIEEELNITVELTEYKEEKRLSDLLGGIFSQQSFFIGKGIGNSLLESRNFNKFEVWT